MAHSSRGSGVLAVGEGNEELGSGVRAEEGGSWRSYSDVETLVVDRANAPAKGSRRGGSRTGH